MAEPERTADGGWKNLSVIKRHSKDQDYLGNATELSGEECKLLAKCLANYAKDYE